MNENKAKTIRTMKIAFENKQKYQMYTAIFKGPFIFENIYTQY